MPAIAGDSKVGGPHRGDLCSGQLSITRPFAAVDSPSQTPWAELEGFSCAPSGRPVTSCRSESGGSHWHTGNWSDGIPIKLKMRFESTIVSTLVDSPIPAV